MLSYLKLEHVIDEGSPFYGINFDDLDNQDGFNLFSFFLFIIRKLFVNSMVK